MKKIMSLIIFVFAFMFSLPANAQTQDLLKIDFQYGNGNPLFSEASFLPGDTVTRWVDVQNLSADKQAVVTRVEGLVDDYDLSKWMDIEIDDDDNGLTTPIYSGNLADFFDMPSYHLGDLAAGESVRYYFSITFSLATPNDMQEKDFSFNLVVAEGALESFGTEKDSGANSVGSSFVYNGLILSNVQVVVGNDSAVITWTTNKNATSRLIYDTVSHPNLDGTLPPNYSYAFSSELADSPALENGVVNHSVNLTGLVQNTTYYFRPISSASPEKAGTELSFKTGSSKNISPALDIERVELGNGALSLTVRNSGQDTALDVRLEDVLPEGTVFNSNRSKQKTWLLGDIAPGGYKTIAYNVKNNNIVADNNNENIQVLAYNHKPLSQSFALVNNPQIWHNIYFFNNYLILSIVLVLIALSLGFFSFIYRKI